MSRIILFLISLGFEGIISILVEFLELSFFSFVIRVFLEVVGWGRRSGGFCLVYVFFGYWGYCFGI